MDERAFIGDVEVHPAAAMYPEMEHDDLLALYESIKKSGIQMPVVMCDGLLLDGRNRMRACLMAGFSSKKVPSVRFIGSDPYEFTRNANLERLNYSPSKKAEVMMKSLAASGELSRLRAEAEEAANRARSEKQRGVPKGETAERVPPHGGSRSKTAANKNGTAAKLAKQAGVSQRTMERQLARASKHTGTRRGKPARKNRATRWSVPRDIADLGAFLRANLTSEDRRTLVLIIGDKP